MATFVFSFALILLALSALALGTIVNGKSLDGRCDGGCSGGVGRGCAGPCRWRQKGPCQ